MLKGKSLKQPNECQMPRKLSAEQFTGTIYESVNEL